MTRAMLGRMTGGVSPAALAQAYADWWAHLATAPGKQLQLLHKAHRKSVRYAAWLPHAPGGHECPRCIEPLSQDRRFEADAWQVFPFNAIHQAFLLTQQWWHNASTEVRGVRQHHEDIVEFATRQLLDVVQPGNFPATNPEVIEKTVRDGGTNFVHGHLNLLEDVNRYLAGEPPVGAETYEIGRDLAVTPGKVVFRNALMELIQYTPQTDSVATEPVLIVPAWIMKYYVLDLSPHNSLIRWLVAQGFTVFCISWKNPTKDDWNIGFDDYRTLGLLEALKAMQTIVPERQIHAVGYCIGGTLLATAAAHMGRDGEEPFASLTLFAAQTDFTNPGELGLFVDESQVSFLEDMMWDQGYLDPKQMKGAFQLLRSNDLVWSHFVRAYFMGERERMIDLMAWNADGTRLPYRMHSEYLRTFYLQNAFAEGRYTIEGGAVTMTNIDPPIFAVASEKDHIAPWRSVYKLHLLADTPVTFVLSSGGHNGAIVSEPGHPRRSYSIATRPAHASYLEPDGWREQAERHDGSWWPAWRDWLLARSSGWSKPPAMGAPAEGYPPIADAPGTYVHEP
nr:alpha/beta fold hydrolase [Limimonas halophila]